MTLGEKIENFLHDKLKNVLVISILLIIIGFSLAVIEYKQRKEFEKNSICWGVRYLKHSRDSCGVTTFLVNSTDEGYYYSTKREALDAGYSAAKSDVEVGYFYDEEYQACITPFKCLCDE